MAVKTSIPKIAHPYAEALMALGQKTNTVDCINKDVNIISVLLNESKDFKSFLLNPIISVKDKQSVVKNILHDQVSDNFLRFLLLLFDRKRIAYLESIIQAYLELSYKQLSIKIAEVVSSSPLSSDQQIALIEKLKVMTGATQVKLILRIDKSLLGGLTIQIGSQLIDTSIKGQLKLMASCLGSQVA
jgi:F-type H+-transporting ATPase subunit delta|tara:strand:+ start:14656 stop:15216 length:561 start_codon:yes stop_codon:yes gene_type:complete